MKKRDEINLGLDIIKKLETAEARPSISQKSYPLSGLTTALNSTLSRRQFVNHMLQMQGPPILSMFSKSGGRVGGPQGTKELRVPGGHVRVGTLTLDSRSLRLPSTPPLTVRLQNTPPIDSFRYPYRECIRGGHSPQLRSNPRMRQNLL